MGLFLFDKNILTRPILEDRKNILYGYIGDNDTGKSVTASEMGLIWRNSRPSYYKIIAHDPQGRYPYADYYIDINDDKWAERLIDWQNILLILDDFRLINMNPKPVNGLTRIMYDRFKNNVDVIYTCHNPMQVINLLTYYSSDYMIFQGNYKAKDFQEKIPNSNLGIAAAIEINNYTKNFGMGTYPNFPYVRLNNKKKTITAINFEKEFSNSLIKK